MSNDDFYDGQMAGESALRARVQQLERVLKALVEMYGPSSDYGHEAQIAWADAEDAIERAEKDRHSP